MSESCEIMELDGERLSGFEHHVWLDRERGVVSKIPSKLGRVWQIMTPEAAEWELDVLKTFDIPIVPTEVVRAQMVSYTEKFRKAIGMGLSERVVNKADLEAHYFSEKDRESYFEVRKKVRYVLRQPLIEPSHAMNYGDLLHNEALRAFILELMQKGEQIREDYCLGLDMLGGKAYKLFLHAAAPFKRKMKGDISNLLIPGENILLNENGSGESEKPNRLIAEKDKPVLCDVRLMPVGDAKGCYRKTLTPLIKKNFDLQYAALWSLLEDLGVDPNMIQVDKRFNTRFKRFVRWFYHRYGSPKMRANYG